MLLGQSKSRRGLIIVCCILAFMLLAGCGSQKKQSAGQNTGAKFPSKEITIICGSKAGAPIDVMARQVASRLEKILGKPVVVENRTGGTQAEALSALRSKPADGHTLVTVTPTTLQVLNTTLKDKFKFEDFLWLSQVNAEPYALVVKGDSQFNTVKDLTAYAKSNPGKIKVGGYGTGSSHHLAFLEMIELAGVKMAWMPFEGAPEALAQVLGGHIDVAHTTPSLALGHIKAGTVKVVGITDKERLSLLPNTPTLKEQGVDQVLFQWRGLIAKAGTPPEVQEKLLAALQQVYDDPSFQQYLTDGQQKRGQYSGPAFEKYAREEFEVAKKRLSQLGLSK